MGNDTTAYTFSRLKAHRGPVSMPQTATALRFLLAAWLIDDSTHWTEAHETLSAHLQDRAWMPSAEDAALFRPGLMAWAERYEMTDLAEKALGGREPCLPM